MKEYTFTEPPDGDRSQGWAILSVTWAFVLCATISTLLRIWVRSRLTRNFGWDDWTMVACLVTTIMGAGLVTCEVFVGGLGRHSFYLDKQQLRMFQAIGWADWIQTFITLALMKISICLFLLRIVDGKRFRWFLYGMNAFLILFTSVCVFLFIGVCRPLKAHWNVRMKATCLSDLQVMNIAIAQGVLSVITDLICAAFPIFFLGGLNMKWRTKIGLCILMGLGVITAACCAVRTALSGAMLDPDLTWAISANLAWRLPECNIGIVCANAPTFRPLYLLLRGRLDTKNRPSKGSYSSGSKTVVPPENARWGARSATLQGSGGDSKLGSEGGWKIRRDSGVRKSGEQSGLTSDPGTLSGAGHGGKDADVELEMGLPVQYPSGVAGVGPGPGYSGRKEAWQ